VGVFHFSEGNGLYIIVGYEEEKAKMLAEDLLDSLSYAGIGGKRSAGLGRFEFRTCKLEESLKVRLQEKGTRYMSLSVSLPKEEELERVVAGADFQMIKRSGFVASSQYADEFLRKKDLYVMNAGACFRKVFDGDVYDVASIGKHPVYRYAKPLLMEVDA
jgi:CRISPR-associated protein Csm4